MSTLEETTSIEDNEKVESSSLVKTETGKKRNKNSPKLKIRHQRAPKPKSPIANSSKFEKKSNLAKSENLFDSSKFSKKSDYYKYLTKKSEYVCSEEAITGDDKKIQEKRELLQALIEANKGFKESKTSDTPHQLHVKLPIEPENSSTRELEPSFADCSEPFEAKKDKNASKPPPVDSSSTPDVQSEQKVSLLNGEEVHDSSQEPSAVIESVPSSEEQSESSNLAKFIREHSKVAKKKKDIPIIFYSKHPVSNNSARPNPSEVVKDCSTAQSYDEKWNSKDELAQERQQLMGDNTNILGTQHNHESMRVTDTLRKNPKRFYYIKRHIKPANFSTYLPIFKTYKDALEYFKQCKPPTAFPMKKKLTFWDVLKLIKLNDTLNKEPDKPDVNEEMSFFMQNFILAIHSRFFTVELMKILNIDTFIKFVNEAYEKPQPILRQPSTNSLLYRRSVKNFVENAPATFCRKFDCEKKFTTRLRIGPVIQEVDDCNSSVLDLPDGKNEEATLSLSDLEEPVHEHESTSETSESQVSIGLNLESISSEFMCADFTGADDEKLVGWTDDFTEHDYYFNFYEVHHPTRSSSEESLDLPKLPLTERDLKVKNVGYEPFEGVSTEALGHLKGYGNEPYALNELKNKYVTNLKSELITRLMRFKSEKIQCLNVACENSRTEENENASRCSEEQLDPKLRDGQSNEVVSYNTKELKCVESLSDLLSQILDNPESVDLKSVPLIIHNTEDIKHRVVQQYKEEVLHFFLGARQKKEEKSHEININNCNSEHFEDDNMERTGEASSLDFRKTPKRKLKKTPRTEPNVKFKSFSAEEENNLIEFAELMAHMRSNLELVDLNSAPRIINNIERIKNDIVQDNRKEALLLLEDAKKIRDKAAKMKRNKRIRAKSLEKTDSDKRVNEKNLKNANAKDPSNVEDFTAEEKDAMMELALLVTTIRSNPESVYLNGIPRIVQNIEKVKSYKVQRDKKEVILFYEKMRASSNSTKQPSNWTQEGNNGSNVNSKLTEASEQPKDCFSDEKKKHIMEFALLVTTIRSNPNSVNLKSIPRIVRNISGLSNHIIQMDKKEVLLFFEKTKRAKRKINRTNRLSGSVQSCSRNSSSKCSTRSQQSSHRLVTKTSLQKVRSRPSWTTEEKEHLREFIALIKRVREYPHSVDLSSVPRLLRNVEGIKSDTVERNKGEVVLFFEKANKLRAINLLKKFRSKRDDYSERLQGHATNKDVATLMKEYEHFSCEQKDHFCEFFELLLEMCENPELVDLSCVPRVIHNAIDIHNDFIKAHLREMLVRNAAIDAKYRKAPKRDRFGSKRVEPNESWMGLENERKQMFSRKIAEETGSLSEESVELEKGVPEFDNLSNEQKNCVSKFMGLLLELRHNPETVDLNCASRVIQCIENIKCDSVRSYVKEALSRIEEINEEKSHEVGSTGRSKNKQSGRDLYERSVSSVTFKTDVDHDGALNYSFGLDEEPELSPNLDEEREFDPEAFMADWENGFALPKRTNMKKSTEQIKNSNKKIELDGTKVVKKRSSSKTNIGQFKSPYLPRAVKSRGKKLGNGSLQFQSKNKIHSVSSKSVRL